MCFLKFFFFFFEKPQSSFGNFPFSLLENVFNYEWALNFLLLLSASFCFHFGNKKLKTFFCLNRELALFSLQKSDVRKYCLWTKLFLFFLLKLINFFFFFWPSLRALANKQSTVEISCLVSTDKIINKFFSKAIFSNNWFL